MKYILFILLVTTITFSCKKDVAVEIKGTRDLKNLSLQQLKNTLKGKWVLQYYILSNAGYIDPTISDGGGSFIIFYPTDSIAWVDKKEQKYFIRDKINYTWKKNSYNDLAFVLSFGYNWTADRMVNDTLIFVDNSRVGSSYYLTRK